MSEQQTTVEQLIEVARTMSSTETLRRKLEQFAAQQRADAERGLERENVELKSRTPVALPFITDEIYDLLGETDLITWDRDNNRPDWTQTAVDAASCFVAQCLCSDRNQLSAELAAAKSELEAAKAQLAEAEKDAQLYHTAMQLLRSMKLDHGLCQPRERRSCTNCNAQEDLQKMLAAYKGNRISMAAIASQNAARTAQAGENGNGN